MTAQRPVRWLARGLPGAVVQRHRVPRGDSHCGVAGSAPRPVAFLALGEGRWDEDGRSQCCTKQLAAGLLWMERVCPEARIVQISPF